MPEVSWHSVESVEEPWKRSAKLTIYAAYTCLCIYGIFSLFLIYFGEARTETSMEPWGNFPVLVFDLDQGASVSSWKVWGEHISCSKGRGNDRNLSRSSVGYSLKAIAIPRDYDMNNASHVTWANAASIHLDRCRPAAVEGAVSTVMINITVANSAVEFLPWGYYMYADRHNCLKRSGVLGKLLGPIRDWIYHWYGDCHFYDWHSLGRLEPGFTLAWLQKRIYGWKQLWFDQSESSYWYYARYAARLQHTGNIMDGIAYTEYSLKLLVEHEKAAAVRKLTGAEQVFNLFSSFGGFATSVGTILGIIWVRKNSTHEFVTMYEERTLNKRLKEGVSLAAPCEEDPAENQASGLPASEQESRSDGSDKQIEGADSDTDDERAAFLRKSCEHC